MRTRVLIVGDDRLASVGLATLLSEQDSVEVVGQVTGDVAYSAATGSLDPQVLLWEMGVDPLGSLETIADASDADVPIVALVSEDASPQQMWNAGIRGLLPRDSAPEAIAAALVAAGAGLTIAVGTTPRGGGPFDAADEANHTNPARSLTAREREVLGLMAEGLPNKSIAARLEISEHTVKFHVNAILGKLGAQSRTEAVVLATRSGLLQL
jgi:DNA-binding NarL/FixJ family response regulator